MFIAIHSEGLKGHFTVLAEKAIESTTLPGGERKLIVHHMRIVDTDAMRVVINEGAPFFGFWPTDIHFTEDMMCTISSARFHLY